MQKAVFLGDTILCDEPLGIQRYAYEIIKAIDEMDIPFSCELLVPENAVCNIEFKKIKVVHYGKHKKGFLWRQLDYSKYISAPDVIGVDLTLGLSVRGSDIVCLHDCIYESYPQEFVGFKNKLKRQSYLLRTRIGVKKAKRIVTVSETSKNELMKHYGITNDRISVVYNAWQHMLRITEDNGVLQKYGLERHNYYFSLGSGLPHKNFTWVVYAAKNNPNDIFVISGTNRLGNYMSLLGDKRLDNVVFTGFLSDGEIKALMAGCKAFLHPAFVEGFGIPPLEALSCGAKILVSCASCLPEIYGDSAVYFDPKDYSADIDKLVAEAHCTKDALDKYSWAESAERLITIINEVMS